MRIFAPAAAGVVLVGLVASVGLVGGCAPETGAVTADAPPDAPPDAPVLVIIDAPPSLLPDSLLPDSGRPPDAGPDAGPRSVLSITYLGTGAGTVTVTASGFPPLECASGCDLPFLPGTHVSLTAQANGSSAFAGWGGACSASSASAACPLTLTTDRQVDATFNALVGRATVAVGVTGPGTVTLDPAGDPCGPGCATFTTGITVTLTPKPDPGYSFVRWTGGACDAARGACAVTVTASLLLSAEFCAYQRVVDTAGLNTNAGTCTAPYRTVTKALSVAVTGDRVLVRPGVYDAAGGETFPLLVPAGVSLLGDELAKGNALVGTEVSGAGASVVTLGKGATLAGLLVSGVSTPAACVTSTAEGVTLRNATITTCADGASLGGASPTVTGLVSTANGVGLRLGPGASGARLEGNVIVMNQTGVIVGAGADLGGGALGSPGGNVLACNTTTDLQAAAGVSVTAKNGVWDHAPPSAGCAAGGDVCSAAGAQVTTDGATQASVPCP